MVTINFAGKKIFEFKDNNIMQVIGQNEELKRLIINIYSKILNGYRFSDIDVEAMNGYFPEIIKKGKKYNKGDILVIEISDIQDIIEQLQVNRNSILKKYLLSLGAELSINKTLAEIEESLIGLTIELDDLMGKKFSTGDINIITNISHMSFKKIIKSFIDIELINYDGQRKSPWLLRDKELIDLFFNIILLLVEKNHNITFIINGLDTNIEITTYYYLVDKIFNLTKTQPNLKVWLFPKTRRGVHMDYKIFEDTYILNEDVFTMGDFDITYESLCRNYPDNNYPTKIQVLNTLLRVFPFHYQEKLYHSSKEAVIMRIFLELLHKDSIKLENTKLSSLETRFLTSS